MKVKKRENENINISSKNAIKDFRAKQIINNILYHKIFLGMCFIGFGFTLITNICLSKYKKNFISGFIGHYAWEYIIIVLIYLLFTVFFTCYTKVDKITKEGVDTSFKDEKILVTDINAYGMKVKTTSE